jgi:hypothetical protein
MLTAYLAAEQAVMMLLGLRVRVLPLACTGFALQPLFQFCMVSVCARAAFHALAGWRRP